MADRVRCKSKSTFDNPFIYNHTAPREGSTTVQDGDEFSTEPAHADELKLVGLAEPVAGDVSDRSDRQSRLIGTQTSAATGVAGNRPVKPAPAPATAAPPTAAPIVKPAA